MILAVSIHISVDFSEHNVNFPHLRGFEMRILLLFAEPNQTCAKSLEGVGRQASGALQLKNPLGLRFGEYLFPKPHQPMAHS